MPTKYNYKKVKMERKRTKKKSKRKNKIKSQVKPLRVNIYGTDKPILGHSFEKVNKLKGPYLLMKPLYAEIYHKK